MHKATIRRAVLCMAVIMSTCHMCIFLAHPQAAVVPEDFEAKIAEQMEEKTRPLA